MATAFVFEASGLRREDYEGLMAALGRADLDAPTPDGFIAQLAGPTEEGWRVIDVRESEEAAGAFYGSAAFQGMLAGAPPIDRTPWALYRVEVDRTLREVGAGA